MVEKNEHFIFAKTDHFSAPYGSTDLRSPREETLNFEPTKNEPEP